MTRLVHLTDLHFGMEHASLVDPLSRAIRDARPDLVVVSGDLAHRARAGQFRAAMQFLRGLALPLLITPGNHDIPLMNLFARFTFPFAGYRRYVGTDLAPTVQVGDTRLFCANTADPNSWRRGILRGAQMRRILNTLRTEPISGTNIFVCHHPLQEPAGFQRGETKGATVALPMMADAGISIVLSGHLHHWEIGLGITPETPQRIFQLQTGTALCARVGEIDHGFAVLDVAGASLDVTPWMAQEGEYTPAPCQSFIRRDGLWYPA